MNREKAALASALVLCAATLIGCSEGDDAVINITTIGGGDSGGPSTNPISTCPAFATARPQTDDGTNVCGAASVILDDQTWTADTIWYLPGRVTVGNGNGTMAVTQAAGTPGMLVDELGNMYPLDTAVLTIEPGTRVQGSTGSFANLIITRGSRIEARGTGTAPIVFSSDDEGLEGSGEWGGLVIQGFSQNNKCGTPPCNITSELLSGQYGGENPDDDSGTLRYVIVAEAGFEFDVDEEINGISFEAVGGQTEVDFVQVHNNADDGFEFFGGTVNAKHVVLSGNQDDSVDWDEGFQGYLQHVLVIQPDTCGSSCYAIEGDTTGTLAFYSLPVIANATFIGNGTGTNLLNLKATTGGYLTHSVFTWADSVVGPTNCINPDSVSVADLTRDLFDVQTEVADCDASGAPPYFGSLVTDVALNGFHASTAPEATAVGALKDVLDAFPTDHPSAFNPDVTTNTERPPAVSADGGFFDDTSYAGAVDPAITDPADLWYAGWTLPGSVPLP